MFIAYLGHHWHRCTLHGTEIKDFKSLPGIAEEHGVFLIILAVNHEKNLTNSLGKIEQFTDRKSFGHLGMIPLIFTIIPGGHELNYKLPKHDMHISHVRMVTKHDVHISHFRMVTLW